MRKTSFSIICFVFVTIFAAHSPAFATDLKMTGTVSYSYSGGYVTLSVERINNNESGGNSGTLKLRLYATKSKYSGGTISGYVLGEYRFPEVLKGGYGYPNVNRTVTFTEPPAGSYYITMVLTEYNNADYIADYRTFDEVKTFGDVTDDDVTDDDICKEVFGNTAYYADECGVCVGGTSSITPDEYLDYLDCAGVCLGSAYYDDCGICVGGTTGKTPCTSNTDCAGVAGGSAYLDSCGICVGGTTGKTPCSSNKDCAGVTGGTAYSDNCGRCVGGTTGLTPCQMDCAGTYGGSAYYDDCGKCVGGTTGKEACSEEDDFWDNFVEDGGGGGCFINTVF